MVSFPILEWVDELKVSYRESLKMQQFIYTFFTILDQPKGYKLQQGSVLKNRRIFLVANSPFKTKVLHFTLEDPIIDHSSYLKTYQRAKRDFIWKSMKRDIKQLVKEYDTC